MPFTGKSKLNKNKLPFDKYDLYQQAVQSPDSDVEFLDKTYRDHRKKKAFSLTEDFCGTALLASQWVKSSKQRTAVGIDLSKEPLEYFFNQYYPKLTEDQKKRLKILNENVLSKKIPKSDIVSAQNFSYFLFKERTALKKYFESVYARLNPQGMFSVDCFGGSDCQDAVTDPFRHKGFTYYWDQLNFNSISSEAEFAIHFKFKGKMYKNIFMYDWRMWSLAEIRDLMTEVGFKKVLVYWEGTNSKGTGNDIFKIETYGEPCLSWIANVVALK